MKRGLLKRLLVPIFAGTMLFSQPLYPESKPFEYISGDIGLSFGSSEAFKQYLNPMVSFSLAIGSYSHNIGGFNFNIESSFEWAYKETDFGSQTDKFASWFLDITENWTIPLGGLDINLGAGIGAGGAKETVVSNSAPYNGTYVSGSGLDLVLSGGLSTTDGNFTIYADITSHFCTATSDSEYGNLPLDGIRASVGSKLSF